MAGRGGGEVDELLLARIAGLSPGSQRWVKTAIQSLTSNDAPGPADALVSTQKAAGPPLPKSKPRKRPASLEDVVTGKADLRDHLHEYPELSEELEGMADVIDMLRDAGQRRRRLGEQILREEILGETPAKEDDEEEPVP